MDIQDVTKVVNEMLAVPGVGQSHIRDRLRARGVESSQPTISRIAKGFQGDCSFNLGVALIELHREICGSHFRSPWRNVGDEV